MNTEKQIKKAATLIQESDAILIGAGAGMGVDSGLPPFRGEQGIWNAHPAFLEQGLTFMDLANPNRFDSNPHMAWGFYGSRLNLYQKTQPHAGFDLLRKWCSTKGEQYFIFTSNVDGQFIKAGFSPDRIHECHGSILHLQCSHPCSNTIWAINQNIDICPSTGLAIDPLPTCPQCGAIARPNIHMFNDWSWYKDRSAKQLDRYHKWISQTKGKRVAVIECGAGTSIPSVRIEMQRRAAKGMLIRINTNEYKVTANNIAISLGAKDSLTRISEYMNY